MSFCDVIDWSFYQSSATTWQQTRHIIISADGVIQDASLTLNKKFNFETTIIYFLDRKGFPPMNAYYLLGSGGIYWHWSWRQIKQWNHYKNWFLDASPKKAHIANLAWHAMGGFIVDCGIECKQPLGRFASPKWLLKVVDLQLATQEF